MPKRKAPIEYDVDRCLTELADAEDEAKRLIARASEDQLRTRPNPDSWCALECIDHLAMTSRAFLPIWDKATEMGRARGRLKSGPYRYGWFSRFFMTQLEPPVERRMRTTAAFLPQTIRSRDAVLADYLGSHREVILRLNALRGMDVLGIKVVSPFSSWIRYPIGASFDILLAHERRHLWQAAQAIARLKRGKPAKA